MTKVHGAERGVLAGGVASLLGDQKQSETVMIPVALCNLPPFRAAAKQVLWLEDHPDLDTREVTALVAADPALAADILFLANSSLFGFPSRIQILQHAVALLGIERVKALAATVATRALLGRGGPLVDECWRHSLASAIVAAEISSVLDVSEDAAYTAALLHDIGRLGLLKSYAREYGGILAGEYDDLDHVLRAERATFQVDHSIAGSWLVGYWSFPATFLEVCQCHHEPPKEQDSGLLLAVKLACGLAEALGYSVVRCKFRLSYQSVAHSAHPLPAGSLPAESFLSRRVAAEVAALKRWSGA